MDSNTQNQPQTFKPTATGAARAASDTGETVAEKVGTAAHAVQDRGAEMVDQAKQKVGEVYEQANKSVTEQYRKAVDYGRENPGTTTLIAFGIGVGVGVLLLSSLSDSRSRRSRVVEPVMSAVSSLARELFR